MTAAYLSIVTLCSSRRNHALLFCAYDVQAPAFKAHDAVLHNKSAAEHKGAEAMPMWLFVKVSSRSNASVEQLLTVILR